MLKSGEALPLRPNTYPLGTVVSGNITGKPPPPPPAPGPTPPFPQSTAITGVTFGEVAWWSGSGDTWPTAVAADGNTYGWDCDSDNGEGFSPMSLWRIDGDPTSGALSPKSIVNNAFNYTELCAALGPTGTYPKVNIKPGGMTALSNGDLIVGVSCINYGDDPAFERQHNLAGFVGRANTRNLSSWANLTSVGSFSGRFAAPVFVSCGRANDGDCLADGVLYVFFPGSFNDESYWDNNDAHFLARVAPSSVADPSAYEFFTGLNDEGAATWSPDSSQAEAPIVFPRMLGLNAVSYHPFLKKFLLANFGFIDNAGVPRPWHQKPFMSPHRTQLIMLEASHPWGPWSMFYRSDDSPPAPGLYTPTFPSALMKPPVDGVAELTMVFACLDGAPNCRYTLNWVPVNFTLA